MYNIGIEQTTGGPQSMMPFAAHPGRLSGQDSMDSASMIATALVRDRTFVPTEETQLSRAGLIEPDWYAFVGVRAYWGSLLSCAILKTNREDKEVVERRALEFYRFSKGLTNYSGRAALSGLGSFGLLVVLHDGPSTEDFRRLVISQKRGSAWRKDYCVVWLLDMARGQGFAHRGLPLPMFPGTAFFRKLLNGS